MDLKDFLSQTSSGKQLSEYQFKLLAKNRIESPQDFLKTDLQKLQNILDIKKVQNVYNIKKDWVALMGRQKKATFDTQYEDEKKNLWDHGTGIKELDNLLNAIGQPCPGVWEVFGDAGVGKTELMYCLAINFVCQKSEQPKHVLFMDCKGDFDAARILEILEERKYPQPDQAMEAIKVEKAFTDQHIIGILRALLKLLYEKSKEALAISLVLIDCMPACFVHLRSKEEQMLAKAQQTIIASLLRKLNTMGVASIVGNISFSRNEIVKIVEEQEFSIPEDFTDTKPDEPLLGHYWKSVCTMRLSLELPSPEDDETDIDTIIDDGIRVLKVITNTYGPAGGNCHLSVSRAGII